MRTKKVLSASIDAKVKKEFDHMCDRWTINKSALVEKLLDQYIQQYQNMINICRKDDLI